jgi:uncharacterized protein YbjT (DUF2867 family)
MCLQNRRTSGATKPQKLRRRKFPTLLEPTMILVTGATGLTGSEAVRRLSARGVPVRALVRTESKAATISDLPGVEIALGDMSQAESLAAPLKGVERALLISSSDPTMESVQATFIAAAKKAGVRHIVKLSGIMPGQGSPFRFARMHAEIERVLEASGVAYTHLRAGQFMQTYFRQAALIAGKGILPLPMAGAATASIDTDDIAEVAARVLTTPGHENKAYPLTGPESLTMEQVAAKLSAAIGRPVHYMDVPPDDAKRATMAAGMPPYMADAIAELFMIRRDGAEAKAWPTIRDVFGFAPRSFDDFAHRHAAIFRGDQPAPRV